MFKQNEYIVTLKVDTNFSTNCARDNWCFKQMYDREYIAPYIDLSESTGNSNGNLQFDKSKELKDWRYATPEEIAEYDKLGKPFDVTTLKPKELSKEELLEEAKRRYPVGTYFKSPDDGYKIREVKPYNIGSDITWYWSEEPKGPVIRSLSSLFCQDVEGKPTCSNPHVYKDGKWAEIVSKPESVEKMEEPKFIVGKWYKRTTEPTSDAFVLYIKCSSTDPIKDCEHITFGGKHNVTVTQGRGYKQWKVLEDLSEIQQYLPEGHSDKFPVSKELTSLPEKWCIRDCVEVSDWASKKYDIGSVVGRNFFHFVSDKSYFFDSPIKLGYTEITLDQFKKWVLKESSEVSLVGRYLRYIGTSKKSPMYGDFFRIDSMESEGLFRLRDNEPNCNWRPEKVINGTSKSFELMPEGFTPPLTAPIPPLPSSQIPEYVECIQKDTLVEVGITYKVTETGGSINGNPTCIINGMRYFQSYFKPSTKEAYEAQQKPQTMVQKWAVGTYVVFLKNYGDNPKGTVDRIGKDFGETIQAATKYIFHDSSSLCNMNKNTEVKWFATQQEAEEFAKTLREPEPVKPSVELKWTPQVGEWAIRTVDNGGIHKIGRVFQISGIDSYEGLTEGHDGISHCLSSVRKALPHEIPSEQTSVKVDTGKKMDSAKTKTSIPESPTFKVGDRVRIVKKAQSPQCMWIRAMDACIGEEGIIEYTTSNGNHSVKGWTYLAESLELVGAEYPVISQRGRTLPGIFMDESGLGMQVDAPYLDLGIQFSEKTTVVPYKPQPSPKVDTALPMISFVTPPREI